MSSLTRRGILRLVASIGSASLLQKALSGLEVVQTAVEDRIRQIKHSGQRLPSPSAGGRSPMQTWIMDSGSPWLRASAAAIDVPGMITDEEARYYEYIGTLYEGHGEVIELGPWLGKSTLHILRGLEKNQHFAGRRLHVFDDFVWRAEWMDKSAPNDKRLPNHACFRHLFEQAVYPVASRLKVTKAKIVDYDGNEALPRIEWAGSPIEMMYIDCGRTLEVNEGWFKIFAPSFVPDVTLLIMEDWRTHRGRPRLWYNQTLWFTEAHPEMKLVHEISGGFLATFLFSPPKSNSRRYDK